MWCCWNGNSSYRWPFKMIPHFHIITNQYVWSILSMWQKCIIKSTKRNQWIEQSIKWNVYKHLIDTLGNVHVPLVQCQFQALVLGSSWLHMMTEHSMYLVTELERRAWEAPDHIISPKFSFLVCFFLYTFSYFLLNLSFAIGPPEL